MRAMTRLLASTVTAFALALLSNSAIANDSGSHSDDPDRIAELARQLVNGEWEEQQTAREALQSDFGAFAVAGLLRYMGTSSDVDERVAAIYTMRRLGSETTLAIIAALHSNDAVLRRNLCQVLRATGDTRAIPTLCALAEHDDSALVRAEAAAAAMAAGASPDGGADRLVKQARAFLSGSSDVVRDDESHERVFYWTGRNVANVEVSEEVYGPAYARLLAEDALRLDPGDSAAQVVLIDSYAAMRTAIGDDDEALAAKLDDLLLLGGAGPEVEAWPEFDASEVEGDGGSLTSGEKRLRYIAALKAGSASADVVSTLAHALSESAVRQVLVVDNNVEELNGIVGMLRNRDTFATGATTGVQGLIRAKEAPEKDAIILRSTLDDISVSQMVSSLGRDVRSKDSPIIVIANEHQVGELEVALGDRVVAVIPGPVNAEVLSPILATAFDRKALNDERMDAVTLSRMAANALAAMDGSSLAPAGDALVGAIGREDEVQIPALRALAKLGLGKGQAAAADAFSDSDASIASREAAAVALAGILAANDATTDTKSDLMAALNGDDAALRTAAARALGKARSLSVEERTELLLDHRLVY